MVAEAEVAKFSPSPHWPRLLRRRVLPHVVQGKPPPGFLIRNDSPLLALARGASQPFPTFSLGVSPSLLPAPDTAFYYRLKRADVRELDPASLAIQPGVLDAVATALSDPTVFNFDPLFQFDAVLTAQAHPLFVLFRIFLSSGLDDLHAWQHARAGTPGNTDGVPTSVSNSHKDLSF
ncbi:hypothetical protein BJY52DRAFT_1187742 [Lactarius psammicola]|nr:hypothetical protein BJY52DRAFT_1187742 [Lactarius psammicola]